MAFPSTPILDDFNRANENPLLGMGRWAKIIAGDTSSLQVLSNTCQASSPAGSRWQSYWTPSPNISAFEVFTTVSNSNGQPLFWARLQNPGPTLSGYMFQITSVPGTASLTKYVNGVDFGVPKVYDPNLSIQANDQIVCQGDGGNLRMYINRGGSVVHATWQDPNPLTNGYIGIGLQEQESVPTMAFDYFGGGNFDLLDGVAPPLSGFGAC